VLTSLPLFLFLQYDFSFGLRHLLDYIILEELLLHHLRHCLLYSPQLPLGVSTVNDDGVSHVTGVLCCEELFGMKIRLKIFGIVRACNYKILRQSLENDKLLWAFVPTITVTYPYLRSQIPRYALNDDEAGQWTGV
jgi:hypothetical protein